MTPYDKLAASGASPLGGQHNARICAGNRRLPRVQTSREKQHSDAREIRLNRQWSAVALWCLFCVASWESCQSRLDSMVPEMILFQNPSLLSKHQCKSVNPHRHCATDTSTRKLSNRTRRAEHGNPSPQTKQITIMAINTTSLRRHWPNLAREKDITHWACTEDRMLKEDQLWF